MNLIQQLWEYNEDGTQQNLIDSDTGPIARAKTGLELTDSETKNLNITDDSDDHFDTWAENRAIEERSQKEVRYDNKGEPLKEKADVVTKRLHSRSVWIRWYN